MSIFKQAAVLGMASLMAVAAQAAVIDEFNSGDNSVTNATGSTLEQRQGPLTGVVADGYRNVKVRNFGPNQATGNIAEANVGDSGVFAVTVTKGKTYQRKASSAIGPCRTISSPRVPFDVSSSNSNQSAL